MHKLFVSILLTFLFIAVATTATAKRLTYADGPSTQFFCKDKTAAEKVADAYEVSDDLTFRVARQLVKAGGCQFSDKVRWEKEKEVSCRALTNGHCIAVQPSFIYDARGRHSSGYLLIEPKGHNTVETPVMLDISTIILNLSY